MTKFQTIFLLLFLSTVLSVGQTQTGQIKIHVYDKRDSLISNVKVEILTVDSVAIKTAFSDKLGECKFDELSEGEYIVRGTASGFVTYYLWGNTQAKQGKTSYINIRLTTMTEFEETIRTSKICNFNEDKKRPSCHICKERKNVIPYAYGLPTKNTMRLADEGKYKLGGCIVIQCRPQWFCKKDKADVLKK